MTSGMSKDERAFLIEHIDGPVLIHRNNTARMRTMTFCIAKGWIRAGHPRSYAMLRPRHSYLTDEGRRALCKALAIWADALVALASIRADRISALLYETGKIPEPEDLDEPAKLGIIKWPLNA